MNRSRRWTESHVGASIILCLLLYVLLGCERKGHLQRQERERSAEKITPLNDEKQGPKVQHEDIRLDPAHDDLDAPFAGLRVRTVGSSWDGSEPSEQGGAPGSEEIGRISMKG